jgi:MFS family permease
VLIACLAFVRPRKQQRVAEPHSWQHLLQGLRYLRRHTVILSTMVLDMVAVLFGGVTALLPIYATDVLDVGATGFGWLRAMPSVGAIIMSLWLATQPPIRHAGRTLLWSVVVFGVATIVFGFSTSYLLSLAMLFLLGAADNISVVIRASVLQLMTPDSMRGRVSAVSAIFIGTSNEMGELESGVAAQWLGLLPTVVGGGFMTLVTVAAVVKIWPELVRLGALEHLEPPEQSEHIVE